MGSENNIFLGAPSHQRAGKGTLEAKIQVRILTRTESSLFGGCSFKIFYLFIFMCMNVYCYVYLCTRMCARCLWRS